MLLYLLSVGLIAAVVSFVLTRLVRMQARRWDIVDRPADRPDGHPESRPESRRLLVAWGGGVALFLAAAGTFAVEFFSSPMEQIALDQDKPFLGGLFIASAWIVAFGFFCDRFGMRWRYRLLGQFVATLIVIGSGLEIHAFRAFGYAIQLGVFSKPLTIFWLLAAINSLSLLDGIDGLATTVGIILCFAITLIALLIGQQAVAIVGAVFTGSLIGFLRFSFPPATIYLGDAGSMLIGLVVGALAIGGSIKATATVGLAAPLAIWSVPMLSAMAPLSRRFLMARSNDAAHREHLPQRLMIKFGKHTVVLAVVGVCCIVTCTGAFLSILMQNDLVAFGSVLLAFFFLRASLLIRT